MFSDARSKKVVLVAHCILNQNAISDGTAGYPGTDEAVVKRLLQSEVGIIQMPCPELLCLGLDRGDPCGGERPVVMENTRIRRQLETGASPGILANLAAQVVFQVEEYLRHGFTVLGIVGINRSPSCGVATTSRDNQEVAGAGAFIALLQQALEQKNIHLGFVGIKGAERAQALLSLQEILEHGP